MKNTFFHKLRFPKGSPGSPGIVCDGSDTERSLKIMVKVRATDTKIYRHTTVGRKLGLPLQIRLPDFGNLKISKTRLALAETPGNLGEPSRRDTTSSCLKKTCFLWKKCFRKDSCVLEVAFLSAK